MAMFVAKRARPYVVPRVVTVALALGLALAVSPALRSEAQASADRQASVWDRQNTNLAAVRIVEEYPSTDLASFSEPLPSALLWIWLGVLCIPCTSTVRRPRHTRAEPAHMAATQLAPVYA